MLLLGHENKPCMISCLFVIKTFCYRFNWHFEAGLIANERDEFFFYSLFNPLDTLLLLICFHTVMSRSLICLSVHLNAIMKPNKDTLKYQ